jgi:hypothetical protein
VNFFSWKSSADRAIDRVAATCSSTTIISTYNIPPSKKIYCLQLAGGLKLNSVAYAFSLLPFQSYFQFVSNCCRLSSMEQKLLQEPSYWLTRIVLLIGLTVFQVTPGTVATPCICRPSMCGFTLPALQLAIGWLLTDNGFFTHLSSRRFHCWNIIACFFLSCPFFFFPHIQRRINRH